MKRVRTITQAVNELRAQDPGTAITEHFIRRLIKEEELPCLKSGTRILVYMDDLENYINNNYSINS